MNIKIYLAVLLFGSMINVNAAPLNTELVINGGAETGDTTGWTSTGIDTVTPDSFATGFGSFVFTGGTGDANNQTLSQIIDVSSNSNGIDANQLNSIFNIQLQSRSDSNLSDQAIVDVFFLDSNGVQLDSFMFIDDINTNLFDWNLFSDTRTVPAGTRSIKILLSTTRTGGSSSDGFFDNISLKLEGNASCRTTYENGILHIPYVDVIVSDPSGSSTVTYEVDMELIPNLEPLSLELRNSRLITE